jgi:hypothetical protein
VQRSTIAARKQKCAPSWKTQCDQPTGYGTALAKMSRKIGLTNVDVEALQRARDRKPAEPLRFE